MATIPIGSWEFVSHGAGTTMVKFNNKLQPDLYVHVGKDGSGNLTVTPSLYVWARKTSSAPYVPYYAKDINSNISYCQIGNQTNNVSGSFPATLAAWKNRTLSYGGTNFEIRCDSDEDSTFVSNCSREFDASTKTRNVDLRIYVRYKDTTTSYMPKAAYDVSGTITLPATLSAPSSVSITNVSTTTTSATVSASVSGAYTEIQYSKDNGANWQKSNVFYGLTHNTTYNFKAQAMNVDSDWVKSSTYTKKTNTIPGPTYSRSVSNITRTSARLNTSVSVNPEKYWRLHWYDINGRWVGYSGNGATGSWTYDQSGLTPNTSYNFYTQVTNNNDGEGTGLSPISFTTTGNAPTINSISATSSRTTASMSASVSYDTNASQSTYQWQYGIGSYNSTSGSDSLSGLTPNSTYNYRLYVKDNWGRATTSGGKTFKTTGNAPTISSFGVKTYNQTSVEMQYSATYDTNDSLSSYKWEYGTSTSYGSTVNNSNTISGLKPNTTYYYKLTVSSVQGRNSTKTGSFKTDPETQTITKIEATGIQERNATFAFTINNPSGVSSVTIECVIYDHTGSTIITTARFSGSSPTISKTIEGLDPGTTYILRATAKTEGQQKTYTSSVSELTFETSAATPFAIVNADGSVKHYNGYVLGKIDIYNGHTAEWINGKYSTVAGETLVLIEDANSASTVGFMPIPSGVGEYRIYVPTPSDGGTISCTLVGTDNSNIIQQSRVYSSTGGETAPTFSLGASTKRLYISITKQGINKGTAKYVEVHIYGSGQKIALDKESIVKIGGKIRYIDICQSGSGVDNSGHVAEVEVYDNTGTNIALNKTVSVIRGTNAENLQMATDGNHSDPSKCATIHATSSSDKETVFRVDLGKEYTNIEYVKLWRYYADNRTYNETKLFGRDGDGALSWKFQSYKKDGVYQETAEGYTAYVKRVNFNYKPVIKQITLDPTTASSSRTDGVKISVSAASELIDIETSNGLEALLEAELIA